MFCPKPAAITLPIITSSKFAGSIFACLIVSFKTVAPTVAKSTSVKLPKKVPIALRLAATI